MKGRGLALLILAVWGSANCTPRANHPSDAAAQASMASTASTPPEKNPAPPADPNALTFADGTPEQTLRTFCVADLDRMLACFDDDSFWNILATIFFASNPTMDDGNPQTRTLWIGMRKDDLAALKTEHRLGENCEVMIRHNRWPTDEIRKRVSDARAGGCASFANALGKMLFVDGVFSEPR